jgi:hypothetical protein
VVSLLQSTTDDSLYTIFPEVENILNQRERQKFMHPFIATKVNSRCGIIKIKEKKSTEI